MQIHKVNEIPLIYVGSDVADETLEAISHTNFFSYLSSPSDTAALLATLKLAIYKYNLNDTQKVYFDATTIYDMQNQLIIIEKKEIKLTVYENLLLRILLHRKNQIVSIETITYIIWGNEQIAPTTVRKLISRVRKKLSNRFIETHQSSGYRLKL